MKFLLHQLDNFEPVYKINCLVLDDREYDIEPEFNKFINYSGDTKRIIYIEEYSLGRARDIWHHQGLTQQKDIIWVANFGGGTPIEIYEKFKQILDINEVNYEKVTIFTNSNYEFEILDRVFTDKKPNYVAAHYCDMIAIRELVQSHKPKKFSFFSRNWNQYRLLSFIDLMQRNILTNSYFSFFNIKNVYKSDVDAYEYYNLNEISEYFYQALSESSNKEWKEQLTDYWETNKFQIFKRMPYTLSGEQEETGEPNGWQIISSTFRNAFENSYFSLVSETYMGSNIDTFQCTEKTIKAIIHRQPFVVYSNKDFLKRMKTYGFKSFGEFIDESYDDILNPTDKIFAINNQVTMLNDMHYVEFKKLMWDMSSVTTYNYNVIMDRIKNPMSRISSLKYNSEIDSVLLKSIPHQWYYNTYGNN